MAWMKASTIQLEVEHQNQLEYYMARASTWLDNHECKGFSIHGHLIGTKAPADSTAEGVVTLYSLVRKAGPEASWRVRDYLEVLTDARATHQDMLAIQKKLEDAE